MADNAFKKAPSADAYMTLPVGDATWTKFTDGATTAAEVVMEDMGYIDVEGPNNTTVRIGTTLTT